jgi:2-keto-4-pentenoate hydratase/2-oxohepta-3-ene-1,7-dioic acid hydratase in catechol pathway
VRLGFVTTASDPRLRAVAYPEPSGVLDLAAAAERLRDAHVAALCSGDLHDHAWLTESGLAHIQQLLQRRAELPTDCEAWLVPDAVHPAPPVPRPGKFIAVGRNYADHLRESQEIWAASGHEVLQPSFPTAFTKYTTSLIGDGAAIVIPDGVDWIDYEIELVVVIGKPAKDVTAATALRHVAGYTICNDIGARRIQRAEMAQQVGIVMAKNFPTFAPLGPMFVSADEIPDPQALDLRLTVNGDMRQEANTRDMIFGVAELIAYFSRLGLEVGDMITTGTPAGVALARPEPERFYLQPGDLVAASIEGLGTLNNVVSAA